jgi:Putative beta-barrel porin-2, OmpL-like. bbp2
MAVMSMKQMMLAQITSMLALTQTASAQVNGDAPATPPAPVAPVVAQPAPTSGPVTPMAPVAPNAALADATPAPEGQAKPAEPSAEEAPWYKAITLSAFVDTYASVNYNLPKTQQDANLYHPYDPHPGFGLAWAGIDTTLDLGSVAAVMQLRLGPSVKNLAQNDFAAPGNIGNLQNAYITWKPKGKDGNITIMGGKFDTLYGAEVAVSHLNVNYTRGFLYNSQPFFHTGLRVDGVFGNVTAKVMAVNGWNNTIDNNAAKSFGAQLSYAETDKFTASIGYLGGPEQAEQVLVSDPLNPMGALVLGNNPGANSRWRHLGDLVFDAKPTKELRLVANATFVADTIVDATGADKSVNWWGVSAIARYNIREYFRVGGRFEFIRDKDAQITAPNTDDMSLITGTLTLEVLPVKYMVIRLDNRIDHTNKDVFYNRTSGTNQNQITSTLGLVVKTN